MRRCADRHASHDVDAGLRPTLTFQRDDVSQANLISSVLVGDGAAAAIVSGAAPGGLHIMDTDTYTFPDCLDAMGFDMRDAGFHIVLSKDVPELIRSHRNLVNGFLQKRLTASGRLAIRPSTRT